MTKKKRKGPAQVKQKKKVWGSKQVLASPFAPQMPSASPETRQQVLQVLLTVFPTPFARRRPRPSKSPTSAPNEESVGTQSSKKPPRLLCGLNEVTRALERREVDLVVVCRDVSPALLVAHIPVLCFMADTPLIVMPGDGTDIGEVFGTRRVLSFAVRKSQDGEDGASGSPAADQLVQSLKSAASPLTYPWLAAAAKHAPVPAFPKPMMVPHRSRKDIG